MQSSLLEAGLRVLEFAHSSPYSTENYYYTSSLFSSRLISRTEIGVLISPYYHYYQYLLICLKVLFCVLIFSPKIHVHESYYFQSFNYILPSTTTVFLIFALNYLFKKHSINLMLFAYFSYYFQLFFFHSMSLCFNLISSKWQMVIFNF